MACKVLMYFYQTLQPFSTFFPSLKSVPLNAEVNWVTAMAYDATQAWIEALEQSSANPTRTDLQKILSSDSFSAPGASSEVRFSRNGDRPISSQLVEVTHDDASSKQYRFEPVTDSE